MPYLLHLGGEYRIMGHRLSFRNKLFIKIMSIFILITVVMITALSYFAYTYTTDNIMRDELDKQKRALEQVNEYLETKYNKVQQLTQNMYRDASLADHVTYLLKHSYQQYLQYRMDQFSLTGSASSMGLDYFKAAMDDDSAIENVILYSSDKYFLYAISRNGSRKLVETNPSKSFIPDAMTLPVGGVSIPNIWLRDALKQQDNHLFAVQSQINDVGTMKAVGQILVYYRANELSKLLANENNAFKGSIVVLAPEGQVIFDSSNRYYGQVYPYANQLNSVIGSGHLEKDSYITTLPPTHLGYVAVGIIPKDELQQSYASVKRIILFAALGCVLLAIFIPSVVVSNYSNRANNIIRFMRKAESGDLRMRIPDSKADELGQIAASFNHLMNELTQHIDRVYKADIKQKHTELTALQARIHPHFLYNTLEVIRMRALSTGANDVAEMIYSLAVLFRSSVRTQTFLSVREEVDLCERYLELFRIRYKDRFRYTFHVPKEIEAIHIVKMTLQPIVENYIVHGMRAEDEDNRIHISMERVETAIRIQIDDNGKGIESDQLNRIQQGLQFDKVEDDNPSLGLRNVNDRLKLTYGKQYGIEIYSEWGFGTTVIVWIPIVQQGVNSDV
ncbi:MAG: sensor histidine kinase [Candidatus Cohnella colombiensis]|uniref:Sensor histidine kinase n=1 Tax=Candidatus Cohnella colombiensis TaxID=3121368 RepID=A0AA95JCJ8_9BACL|nr:MAG: sensor histidine kinase [Cohnella sp.]